MAYNNLTNDQLLARINELEGKNPDPYGVRYNLPQPSLAPQWEQQLATAGGNIRAAEARVASAKVLPQPSQFFPGTDPRIRQYEALRDLGRAQSQATEAQTELQSLAGIQSRYERDIAAARIGQDRDRIERDLQQDYLKLDALRRGQQTYGGTQFDQYGQPSEYGRQNIILESPDDIQQNILTRQAMLQQMDVGRAPNVQITPGARGAAYKPQPKLIEGTVYDMKTGQPMWSPPKIPEGLDKETKKEINNQRIAIAQTMKLTESIKSLVGRSPEVVGFLGKAQRTFAGLAAQIEGVYRLASGDKGVLNGLEVDRSELRDPNNYTLGRDIQGFIDEHTTDPNKAAIIKANLISLAYAVASAEFKQTGRAISDRDIELVMERIGASTGDPEQMVAVLDDMVRSVQDSFDIYLESVTTPVDLTPYNAGNDVGTGLPQVSINKPSDVFIDFDEHGRRVQ